MATWKFPRIYEAEYRFLMPVPVWCRETAMTYHHSFSSAPCSLSEATPPLQGKSGFGKGNRILLGAIRLNIQECQSSLISLATVSHFPFILPLFIVQIFRISHPECYNSFLKHLPLLISLSSHLSFPQLPDWSPGTLLLIIYFSFF